MVPASPYIGDIGTSKYLGILNDNPDIWMHKEIRDAVFAINPFRSHVLASQTNQHGGLRLSPSTCLNDIASSSCETARLHVNLSGRQGRWGIKKDEKEDEKPQIQSATASGAEGK